MDPGRRRRQPHRADPGRPGHPSGRALESWHYRRGSCFTCRARWIQHSGEAAQSTAATEGTPTKTTTHGTIDRFHIWSSVRYHTPNFYTNKSPSSPGTTLAPGVAVRTSSATSSSAASARRGSGSPGWASVWAPVAPSRVAAFAYGGRPGDCRLGGPSPGQSHREPEPRMADDPRRRPSRGCTTRSPSATAPRSSSSPSGSRFPSCFAPSCGLGFAARRAHGRPLPRRRARPRSIRSQPGRRNPPARNCHPDDRTALLGHPRGPLGLRARRGSPVWFSPPSRRDKSDQSDPSCRCNIDRGNVPAA